MLFSAIDHTDYHASMHANPNPQSSKSTNYQRSRRRPCPSCKMIQCFDLSAYEIEYLSKKKVTQWTVNRKLLHNITRPHPRFMSKRVKKPSHHNHMRSHSRQKQLSLLPWLFGWGVYMNVRNIRKIKQILQILQNQNDLQESQILELIHYLNLTMIQV